MLRDDNINIHKKLFQLVPDVVFSIFTVFLYAEKIQSLVGLPWLILPAVIAMKFYYDFILKKKFSK
jgi:hypothetical protein